MNGASRKPDRKARVLVTRAAGQASSLAEELQRLDVTPVFAPTIEIVPPDSFTAFDAALKQLPTFDWLLFTSANAVRAMFRRAEQQRLKLDFSRTQIGAVGNLTSAALQELGLRANLIPPVAVAESFAEALVPFARKQDGSARRFLLIRAQEGREHLPQVLREAGAEVVVAAAYKTQLPAEGLTAIRALLDANAEHPDCVTLTSSSAAVNFFALLSEAGVQLTTRTAIASIGPITSNTLCELGHPPDVEAPEASVAALARATASFLRDRK